MIEDNISSDSPEGNPGNKVKEGHVRNNLPADNARPYYKSREAN